MFLLISALIALALYIHCNDVEIPTESMEATVIAISEV